MGALAEADGHRPNFFPNLSVKEAKLKLSPVPSLNKDFPEVKKGERLGSEGEKRRREEGALK